jgi:disulfide bond formation protein DsbB
MRKTLIALIALLMLATVACGDGGGESTTTAAAFTADPVRGLELYRGTCIVCHGEGGVGIEGLGKPWVGSTFINERTDAEMLAFLQVGRPADDPLNTTGIAMLPRGGNPNLSDEDLLDLIAYMRTLSL